MNRKTDITLFIKHVQSVPEGVARIYAIYQTTIKVIENLIHKKYSDTVLVRGVYEHSFDKEEA